MGTQVTADIFVKPIVHDHRELQNKEEPTSTDIRPNSDGIVRYIADIRHTISDAREFYGLIQQDSSVGADVVSMLHIQAVRFDNTCKFLFLMIARSRQDVDNMFEDPDHAIWLDMTAHLSLERKMTRFYGLCLGSLEHCRQDLNEIQEGLRLVKKRQFLSLMKCYYRRDGLKSSITSTMQDVSKLLHERLRNHVDLFSTLVRQAVITRCGNMAGSSVTEDLGHANHIGRSRATYCYSGNMHVVSQLLYDTLANAWTCREHKTHGLNLSLSFIDANASGTISCKGFCFNVVVTIPDFGSSSERKLLELKIQARYSPSTELDAGAAASETIRRTATIRRCLNPMQNIIRDLGLENDLCLCLRESSAAIKTLKQGEDTCFGFLKTGSGFHFLLFHVFQEQSSHSLDDILSCQNNKSRNFSVERRLRLALFLGAGFLYLRASSWLQDIWSSKDVYFFNVDGSSEEYTLAEAFLHTQMSSLETRRSAPEVEKSDAIRSGLLSLGLILIEIAFSAPWRKLRLREDVTKLLTEQERNFVDLMRLSETVSRELGSRYAKVVRTCLSEGLGVQNTRGRQADLDEIICEDIVQELNECLLAVSDDLGMSDSRSISIPC